MATDKNINNKAKKSKTTVKSKNSVSKPKKSTSNSKKKATPKNNKKNKSKISTFIKGIFLTMLLLGIAIFVVGLGYVFAIIKSTPSLDIQAVKNLSQPTSLYDSNEGFMDNLHSEVERTVISGDEMPQALKDAYVSIEDQRFYSHKGIDIIRIGGSIVTDIKKIFVGDSGYHGGSTLTQQLLKNTILSNEDFIVERKIKEIWLALQLEKHMTKDEIITQYLNTIPLGGTAYGVEAASNLYFGKSAKDLNLIECAFIAGITQAPSYYSPYMDKNKDNPSVYINRTKTVLDKMLELDKITQAEHDEAYKLLDNNGLVFSKKTTSYNLKYEWYINPTVAKVKEDLKKKYKYTDEEVSKLLANGGLKIYTNMNRELQDYTQQVLNETNLGDGDPLIENSVTPKFQAAATIVDYNTGKVVALVGGRGEHTANSTNRAYSEFRSIGSCTKPLTVYGPALNEHLLTAGSTIDDAPLPENIANQYKGDDGKPYNPQNDDSKYSGNIPIREGLKYSKNVVATLTAHKIGIDIGKTYGEKFGLVYNPKDTGISTVALGQFGHADGYKDGGTPYILANAFGVFGNNGLYTEPNLYSKVVDANGKVLLSTEDPKTTEIFSPQTAYIMYDMLKGSRSITGPSAQWGAMPVAGKTGTPTKAKDLWFSGVTPYYSGSVWLGYYNSTEELDKYGLNSNSAAAVFGKIMAKAHEGLEVKDITPPSGIVTATICQDSGKLATDLCRNDPRGDRVYTEMFEEGTEPTSYCDAHVQVKINSSNHTIATENTPKNLITEGIFVKKQYVNPQTADYPYTVPSTVDDTISSEEPETNSEEDNKDTNKDTDKNQNTNNDTNDNKNNNTVNNDNWYRNLTITNTPNGYILSPVARVVNVLKLL